MKIIKAFAILALLFSANVMSAQSVAGKWPALKTYDEVISRINNGVEQNNIEAIRAFSSTLESFSQRLTATEIPSSFNKPAIKTSVTTLQNKTKTLNDLVAAKGSDANLKAAFMDAYGQYQQVLSLMADVK